MMTRAGRLVLASFFSLAAAGSVSGQFVDDFDVLELSADESGLEGWSFFTGDGTATMDLVPSGEGFASILVDATGDRRNVWWALIKRRVSDRIDLERLARPGWELRVEARIRTSCAPRRVNLHFNTQRTTDFHSHLMEFDIPVAGVWTTISMTTSGFPVASGDTVFAQLALMDWGRSSYRVDVDSFKVDVVEAARAGADRGASVPYHPPIPDPADFEFSLESSEAAVVDLANPSVNLGQWSALDAGARRRVLTVNGAMWVILRWDLGQFRGRMVSDHGLLELATHSVQRSADEMKDMGLVRVVEILGGDPAWRRDTVTLDGLLQGEPPDEVFNPQMIIDWPVDETAGGKTRLTISRPVLQRLVDGRTLGLAVTPLGPIDATFLADGRGAPRLLFNIEKKQGGQ
jgi:hypothetical protein